MEEVFNAKEMNELANAYVRKNPGPLGDMINRCIRARARTGHHDIEFVNEEKIEYILSHEREYVGLGFSVLVKYDYGFPEVTISW